MHARQFKLSIHVCNVKSELGGGSWVIVARWS